MESSNLLNSFQRISKSIVEIVDKGQSVDVRTLLEIKDAAAFCTMIFKNDKELAYTSVGPSMVKNFIEVMDLSIVQGIIPLVKDNDTLILLFQIIRHYVALLDITNATLNNEVMELLKAQNSNILHNQGELVFGNILDISTDDSFSIEVRLDAAKLLWESLKYNHYFYEILITSGQIHKLIGCLDTVVAQSNDRIDYILRCFCGCIYSICKGVSVLPGVFKETVTLVENLVQVFKNNEEPLTRLFAGFSLSYIICENPEYKDNEKVRELIGYIMQNDIYAIYKETISNTDIEDGQGNTVHSFLINDDLYDDGLVIGQQNKSAKPLNSIDNSSAHSDLSTNFVLCPQVYDSSTSF